MNERYLPKLWCIRKLPVFCILPLGRRLPCGSRPPSLPKYLPTPISLLPSFSLLPSPSSYLSPSSHLQPPIPSSYFPSPFLNMSSSHLLLRSLALPDFQSIWDPCLWNMKLNGSAPTSKSRQWKTLVVGAGKEKANWMRVKPSPCFSEERFWSPVVCLKKKDIYWVSLTYPLTCKLYIKFTLLKVKPSPCLSKERLWSPSGPCFICWVSLTCSLIMQRF